MGVLARGLLSRFDEGEIIINFYRFEAGRTPGRVRWEPPVEGL